VDVADGLVDRREELDGLLQVTLALTAMPGKILCVAEKNSIAKAVAEHLSGGHFQTVSGLFIRFENEPCFQLNFVQGKYWQSLHQELFLHV
jgi:hypothetical protein